MYTTKFCKKLLQISTPSLMLNSYKHFIQSICFDLRIDQPKFGLIYSAVNPFKNPLKGKEHEGIN